MLFYIEYGKQQIGHRTRHQMVLLKKRATNVLQSVHNGVSGGHLGINKILDKVRERFYWIKCRDDLVQLIKG